MMSIWFLFLAMLLPFDNALRILPYLEQTDLEYKSLPPPSMSHLSADLKLRMVKGDPNFPSLEEMRANFNFAQHLLQPDDSRNFESMGIDLGNLLKAVTNLDDHTMKLFLGTGKHFDHDLNKKGLQVLRVVLTNRIQDWLRNSRKPKEQSPRYDEFVKEGVIQYHYEHGEAAIQNLTSFLRDITGFHYLKCANNDFPYTSYEGEGTHPTAQNESLKMGPEQLLVSPQNDMQQQLHMDNLMPRFKVFYFPKILGLNQGPFHYVAASHGISLPKMQWLYQITKSHGPERLSLRYNLTNWEYATQTHSLKSLGFNEALPYGMEHSRTLVIADTQGLHFRGSQDLLGSNARLTARPEFVCDGGVSQKNLYRCLTQREAC